MFDFFKKNVNLDGLKKGQITKMKNWSTRNNQELENKTISKDDEKILIKISKMEKKKLPYKLEFFINLIDK